MSLETTGASTRSVRSFAAPNPKPAAAMSAQVSRTKVFALFDAPRALKIATNTAPMAKLRAGSQSRS